ncbi:MAG TPA: hypothetical protein VFY26_22740 [Anaerolineales bacterium]|nr:hypothetical protein [Anaerolineales bacterium]
MRNDYLRSVFILVFVIVLAGCGGAPVTPAATNTEQARPSSASATSAISSAAEPDPGSSTTPDVCSTELIEAEVQKVHRHMREFDDASILASKMPREELSEPIAGLQRIRREAEDEQIPTCLINLKTHQVDHMNSVIGTLIAFIGGADRASLEQSILIAREQHDRYTLELARLLGLTVVPATVPVLATPEGTSTP